jgi:hypothetical protein
VTWRLSINIELGKDEPPEREGSTDALVERAEPQRVGFSPWTDPTRRPEDEG